jgi:thiol-disulfide isomerase/thioredoxin
MPTLIDTVNKYIKPYAIYVIALIIFILFVIAGRYAYNTFYLKKINNPEKIFTDVANANRNKPEVIIYFFNVDWCPHCKTALPEWDKFKNEYDGKQVNGNILKCVSINCTEENDQVSKMINEYKIEGYPTVKMLKDGQKIEFDSKIIHENLEQFVNTML